MGGTAYTMTPALNTVFKESINVTRMAEHSAKKILQGKVPPQVI